MIQFKDPSNFNVIQLQNAYNHILSHHNNNQDFNDIFELLLMTNDDKISIHKCDPQTCQVIHNKNEIFSRLVTNYQESSLDAHLITELFLNLHLYIIHSYDLNFRLTPKEEQELLIATKTGGSADIDTNSIYQTMGEIFERKKANTSGVYHDNKKQLHKDRFISKLTKEIEYKVDVKDDKKEDKDEEKDNSKLIFDNIYSFGIRWLYWKRYQNMSVYYVQAKYKNLKSEIFNNSIFNILTIDWQFTNNKVMTYLKCDNARQLSANGLLCYYYDIKQNSSIKEHHLQTLVFYCNYDKLQLLFSRTFRMSNEYPRLEQVKTQNRECAIWSKFLREAVEIFGQAMRDLSEDEELKFYHGINCELLFPSTTANFASPTSTTIKISVALNFATENGLIIVLSRYGLDVCSFDCKWISKFAGEEERLFIGGYQALIMNNIIVTSVKKRLSLSISAINILQMIIEARFNQEVIPDDMEMEKVIARLRLLIEMKLKKIKNDNQNKKDEYINRLFTHICNQWSSPIQISLFHLHNQKHFYALMSSLFYHQNSDQFNFQLLLQLFPATPKILLISDLDNNHSLNLSSQMMQSLFSDLSHEVNQKSNNNQLFEIELYAPNESQISIIECISQFSQQFEEISWILSNVEAGTNNKQHSSLLLQRSISDTINADAVTQSKSKSL